MALVTLAHARALLTRVAMLEIETAADDLLERLQRDPEWLLVPPARRDTALKRHRAMTTYERIEKPTVRDADDAAKAIGVTRRIFYRLLADWREKDRSAFTLVPYRTLAEPRRSKLPEPVVAALRDTSRKVVAENRSISPSAAVRLVIQHWPSGVSRPSDVTVRNYIDREMAEQPTEVGSVPIDLAFGRMTAKIASHGFGEVLVVDHTAPARMRVDGELARAPTITLVMDLHTGIPVGASVSLFRPSAQGALDALADARARLARRMTNVRVSPPTVVMGMPVAAKWSKDLAVLREGGCRVVERGVRAPRIGEMVRRLLGPKLDGMPLMAARADEDGVFEVDVKQEALLSLSEARFVVDAALEEILDRRLAPEIAGGMAMPLLPEALAARTDLATLRSKANEPSDETSSEGQAPSSARAFEARLRSMAIDAGGDELVGLAIHLPSTSEPHWVVDLRPASAKQGHRLWRTITEGAFALGDLDDEAVVVRLRAFHE